MLKNTGKSKKRNLPKREVEALNQFRTLTVTADSPVTQEIVDIVEDLLLQARPEEIRRALLEQIFIGLLTEDLSAIDQKDLDKVYIVYEFFQKLSDKYLSPEQIRFINKFGLSKTVV